MYNRWEIFIQSNGDNLRVEFGRRDADSINQILPFSNILRFKQNLPWLGNVQIRGHVPDFNRKRVVWFDSDLIWAEVEIRWVGDSRWDFHVSVRRIF